MTLSNVGLTASIDVVWLQQAWYFDRDDVALKGFHKFFKKNSEEEREHAEKMMKYQNLRGGRVVLQPIDVRKTFIFKSSHLK